MPQILRFVALGMITSAIGCGGDVASDDTAAPPSSTDVEAGALDDAATSTPQGDAAPQPAGPSHVGDPCTNAASCPSGGSGTTVCLNDWPGGYCAVAGCAQHGHDCPDDPGLGGTATVGSKCVLDPDATCLALCATDSDCRDGYSCQSRSDAAGHGTAKVCVPASGSAGPAMDGGAMGGGDGGMMGDGGM